MQDLDWKIHEKFYSQVGEYLTDDGSIMLMEAWDGSRPETFESMLKDNGLEYHKFYASKDLPLFELHFFELQIFRHIWMLVFLDFH